MLVTRKAILLPVAKACLIYYLFITITTSLDSQESLNFTLHSTDMRQVRLILTWRQTDPWSWVTVPNVSYALELTSHPWPTDAETQLVMH